MKKSFKIFLFILLLFMTTVISVNAEDGIKTNAIINTNFSTEEPPKEIIFVIQDEINLADGTIIPLNSIIKAGLYQFQKEKRWHKAGFFICIPSAYYNEINKKAIEITPEQEIYLLATKAEKINKKEAAISTTEIVLSTGSSFFVPGVDVLYFFTKGAIQREDHSNWFKSGVSNAYNNSICWIWLKGKPIELQRGDYISITKIKKEKAQKINDKIEKNHAKKELKAEKKLQKQNRKKNKNKEQETDDDNE